MNARDLKVALNRAGETQAGLARRLGHSRSMVTDWVKAGRVPDEWVPLVWEALGIEPEPEDSALARFTTTELLIELLDRERKLRRPEGQGNESANG